MPVLDGLEATKYIRKLNIDTPIVALTANAMQNDQFLYQQTGMNGFLASFSIQPEELDLMLVKYQILKQVTTLVIHDQDSWDFSKYSNN